MSSERFEYHTFLHHSQTRSCHLRAQIVFEYHTFLHHSQTSFTPSYDVFRFEYHTFYTHSQTSLRHHMTIPWATFIKSENIPAKNASLQERASIVGRIGILMLSCGTGAWRVRDAMNKVARKLDLTCSADIGLISLELYLF